MNLAGKWAILPRLRTLSRRANTAMASRDWSAAAAAYGAMLKRRPQRADLRIQLGHCLKEAGDLRMAANAYARAAQDSGHDAPVAADACFHLGQLQLHEGQNDDAIASLNKALQYQPLHSGALELLWHASLLLDLPPETQGRVRTAIAGDITAREQALANARARLAAIERHPARDYTHFRPQMTLGAPSLPSPIDRIDVVIDGREFAPAYIRATLESLFSQSFESWHARVHVETDEALHPVASLADLDPRVTFATPCTAGSTDTDAAPTVFLSAGSRLDAEALAWIGYGLCLPDAAALSCDWDWCTHAWDGPLVHADPHLYGLFDLDRLLAADMPPPLIALRQAAAKDPLDGEERRHALAEMATGASIGHIPLPLVAVGGIAERAKIAPENGENMPSWSQPHAPPRDLLGLPLSVASRSGRPALPCGPIADADERIRIIIPTRDCVADLTVAVDSLLATARRPDRLTICLIDNRSVEPETTAYLHAARTRAGFEILTHDKAFNWSAINNLGAQGGDEPILLLANNDICMLSSGWDDRLRGQLQRADVGVVGARLLYPDGGLQHAGIVFGIHEGAPQHDGVDVQLADPAHDPQFDRAQACSAVTGAFLGLRREVFEAAGKLDAERFIIAYNDIDLCLSVRALGRSVLYDPGIEAIHYESRTRGLNDSRRRVAWDQEELRALYAKWGEAMRREPGLSPWWARDALYTALRTQTSENIARHMRDGLTHRWRPYSD